MPWLGAWSVGTSSHTPKGAFDPCVGHLWEAANQCFSLTSMFLSLSPFFLLSLNSINISLGEDFFLKGDIWAQEVSHALVWIEESATARSLRWERTACARGTGAEGEPKEQIAEVKEPWVVGRACWASSYVKWGVTGSVPMGSETV